MKGRGHVLLSQEMLGRAEEKHGKLLSVLSLSPRTSNRTSLKVGRKRYRFSQFARWLSIVNRICWEVAPVFETLSWNFTCVVECSFVTEGCSMGMIHGLDKIKFAKIFRKWPLCPCSDRRPAQLFCWAYIGVKSHSIWL
jgi:hypothetical protein